jgi:hypothetical protein
MREAFQKTSTRIGLLLAIIATLCVGAKSQSLDQRIRANVPFDFAVAGKTLAAGQYSISRAQQTTGDLVLQVASAKGQTNVFALTIPVQNLHPRSQSVLVFHRYGSEYFLVEIWPATTMTARSLPKSKKEREAQQRLRDQIGALKGQEMETVTVLADRM